MTLTTALLSPLSALASTEFTLTEADFFEPLPTVLSATRLVQPLADAPVAMTVIDREMIEASSVNSIAELLSLAPGFQVTFTEGIEAISTYQGFSDSFPRRMQVLVDGRSVYTPALNGVVWAALPLTKDQIERIEIVRGPNAAAFGSNAFMGTVNIITRTPEASDRVNVRTMTGSADTREIEASHAGSWQDLAYRVTASKGVSSGFPSKQDDNESQILNLQASYRPTLQDRVVLSAGLRNTFFDSESFRVPRGRKYKSNFQQLTWEHMISADEDLQIQVYHNAIDSPDEAEFDLEVPGIPVPVGARVDYSLNAHRYDFEVQHRWKPATDWRVSWGGGARRDTAKGEGIFISDDRLERDMLRLFANTEWRATPDTLVNVGLMAEDFDDLGDFYSPRLAVNQRVADRHTLRASVAQAYRMPTLAERYGDVKVDILLPGAPDPSAILGTPYNDAERIQSVELGYLFELPGRAGTLDLRLFHNEIEFLLYDAQDRSYPSPRPRRFINAGALRTTGMELQADLKPTRNSRLHLAYAYTDGRGSRIHRTDASDRPFPREDDNPRPNNPSVPEHTLTAMGILNLADDVQLSGTYYHVSAMEWLGEGEMVDAKNRFDVRLSKAYRHADGDLELVLNVQNLFDDPYWEFAATSARAPEVGNLSERRIYAELRYTLR
jgi:iron complex outermembrane receptor protein